MAVVAIALSALSTLAVHRIMLNQLDDQLSRAVSTQDKGPGHRDGDDQSMSPRGINMPGLPPRTIVVTTPAGVEPSISVTRGHMVGSERVESINLATAEQLVRAAQPRGQHCSRRWAGQLSRCETGAHGDHVERATSSEIDVVALPTAAWTTPWTG